MKFAVKTVTCLGCKTPLRGNKGGAVCENCRPKLPELYQKQVAQTSALQIDFARLWTQCQRCQGSLHQVRILRRVAVDTADVQDVICTSADCPAYYLRTQTQQRVAASVEILDRFQKEQTW